MELSQKYYSSQVESWQFDFVDRFEPGLFTIISFRTDIGFFIYLKYSSKISMKENLEE